MTKNEKTLVLWIAIGATTLWLVSSAVMISRVNKVAKVASEPVLNEEDEAARLRRMEREMTRQLDEVSGTLWAPEILESFEEFAATDGKLFSPRFQMTLAMAIAEQHHLRREKIRLDRENASVANQ